MILSAKITINLACSLHENTCIGNGKTVESLGSNSRLAIDHTGNVNTFQNQKNRKLSSQFCDVSSGRILAKKSWVKNSAAPFSLNRTGLMFPLLPSFDQRPCHSFLICIGILKEGTGLCEQVKKYLAFIASNMDSPFVPPTNCEFFVNRREGLRNLVMRIRNSCRASFDILCFG